MNFLPSKSTLISTLISKTHFWHIFKNNLDFKATWIFSHVNKFTVSHSLVLRRVQILFPWTIGCYFRRNDLKLLSDETTLWSIFQGVKNRLAFIHKWFFNIEDLQRPDWICGSSLSTFPLTSGIEISHILWGVDLLFLQANWSWIHCCQPPSLWLHLQVYFQLILSLYYSKPIQLLEASSPIRLIAFPLWSSSLNFIEKWRGIHKKRLVANPKAKGIHPT